MSPKVGSTGSLWSCTKSVAYNPGLRTKRGWW